MYINKRDDIVSKYEKSYHSTIKMMSIDVKSSKYIDSSKESNDEDHKFKMKTFCKRFCSKLV